MYILGDIGNTETKIFLVNKKNKILKKINFQTKNLNQKLLKYKFNRLFKDNLKIEKILFCSVVPKYLFYLKNIYQIDLKSNVMR